MDLKFNHLHELYTADLKIYRQLVHLKNIDEFGFYKTDILYLFQHEGKVFRVIKVFRSSFGRTQHDL